MVTFRAEEDDVVAADRWAAILGVERSQLLRDALAGHLARLSAEGEVLAYEEQPFTDDEVAFDTTDAWGPAEDLADWAIEVDRDPG